MKSYIGLYLFYELYCGSGTAGCCCICAGQTLRVHSPDVSTFLREMTSWTPSWKSAVKSKIRLRQSIHIYSKNMPAKFHHNPVWSDGAWAFLKRSLRREEEQQADCRDMKSLPGQKSCTLPYGFMQLLTNVFPANGCYQALRPIDVTDWLIMLLLILTISEWCAICHLSLTTAAELFPCCAMSLRHLILHPVTQSLYQCGN